MAYCFSHSHLELIARTKNKLLEKNMILPLFQYIYRTAKPQARPTITFTSVNRLPSIEAMRIMFPSIEIPDKARIVISVKDQTCFTGAGHIIASKPIVVELEPLL